MQMAGKEAMHLVAYQQVEVEIQEAREQGVPTDRTETLEQVAHLLSLLAGLSPARERLQRTVWLEIAHRGRWEVVGLEVGLSRSCMGRTPAVLLRQQREEQDPRAEAEELELRENLRLVRTKIPLGKNNELRSQRSPCAQYPTCP